MINLRYHIVSLVAVFLALAMGVIVGTNVINQRLVDTLRRQRIDAVKRLDDLNHKDDGEQAALSMWGRFGETVFPPLLHNRLRARRVVLLETGTVAAPLADSVEGEVVQAGGSKGGRMAFTDKWRLADEPGREQLALALESTAQDRGALLGEAARAIAQRLSSPGDLRRDSDLLSRLSRAGFLTLDGTDEAAFPPKGAIAVLLPSGTKDPAPATDDFTLPFLRALSHAMPTAVADSLVSQESLTDQVLRDDQLGVRAATVDHVDTLPGLFALVAGLQALVAGRPALHFGIRPGTTMVAPAA